MSVAPHLVDEAVRLGLIEPDETWRYLSDRRADPPEWDDYATRLEAAIAMCASGAPAFDHVDHFVEDTRDGRRLPPPRKVTK